MNAKNENRLNMYLVMQEFLNTVPATTLDTMPGFGDFFANFTTNVELIRTKNESQQASRVGYRMMKSAGKRDTVTNAIFVANCINAYALSANNLVLEQQIKFTKSELLKKRDSAMADDVQFIISKAIEYLAEVTPFGIKQEQINELTTKLENYNANIPLPRVNINKRKLLTKEINELFIATDAILTRMDSLVDIMVITDNDFYVTYYYSRKIVNNHGRKLSLRGYVTTTTTESPIVGVKVTIPALNAETKTTERGYYEFKNLPAGMHNLIFNRVDFVETRKQAGVISGQRVQLNVTMNEAQATNKVA